MKISFKQPALFIIICSLWLGANAQAKLTEVKQSTVTGLALPDGSKQDKRMLSIGGAKLLLEMVSKKAGVTLKNTEVLYLLPVNINNFTNETLKTQMQQLGWNIHLVDGEPEYLWLEQNGRFVLAYYLTNKKETNLYFADANQAPGNIVMGGGTIQQQPEPVNQTINPQEQTTTQQQTFPEQQQTVTIQQTNNVNSGYAFNTTNFDDGWTSTIHEDWVEVTKGNIKVLLHYPKDGTVFPAAPDQVIAAAWNILVAPRYSQLTNYKNAYVEINNRPYFGMGSVTEASSGNTFFVVLFRRGGGWMEVITPDVKTFTSEFGFNPETIRWAKVTDYSGGYVVDNSMGQTVLADEAQLYNKLENMMGRNKFAVAASDLDNTGRWNANYNSNTFYYNYYTGNSAGMSTFSASEWYDFKGGNNYHWEAVMTNTGGGNMNAAQSKSDGSFKSPNNWQLYFSNIGGNDKTFDVYFSAIKGGRILWVNDANHPGSGIFTGLTRKK
ncbi:hypothetical protein ESA94_03615 [Lacibacter luteus]|uniref:Uncharacterized protein n=1 Tax=Lacibacter luteus TaxID=2508719 RepID=A0A4Q1CM67_9BACT|nr:hypothetical protein [Lacibacter luteus]RXK62113.1 hypothetical protein ESA94_03615 [Lacibacter luteus]